MKSFFQDLKFFLSSGWRLLWQTYLNRLFDLTRFLISSEMFKVEVDWHWGGWHEASWASFTKFSNSSSSSSDLRDLFTLIRVLIQSWKCWIFVFDENRGLRFLLCTHTPYNLATNEYDQSLSHHNVEYPSDIEISQNKPKNLTNLKYYQHLKANIRISCGKCYIVVVNNTFIYFFRIT